MHMPANIHMQCICICKHIYIYHIHNNERWKGKVCIAMCQSALWRAGTVIYNEIYTVGYNLALRFGSISIADLFFQPLKPSSGLTNMHWFYILCVCEKRHQKKCFNGIIPKSLKNFRRFPVAKRTKGRYLHSSDSSVGGSKGRVEGI